MIAAMPVKCIVPTPLAATTPALKLSRTPKWRPAVKNASQKHSIAKTAEAAVSPGLKLIGIVPW